MTPHRINGTAVVSAILAALILVPCLAAAALFIRLQDVQDVQAASNRATRAGQVAVCQAVDVTDGRVSRVIAELTTRVRSSTALTPLQKAQTLAVYAQLAAAFPTLDCSADPIQFASPGGRP